MKYKSVARWPKGTCDWHWDNQSDDTHETKDQAFAVCRRLEVCGFGGDRTIFPLATWVEKEGGTFKVGDKVKSRTDGIEGEIISVSEYVKLDWTVKFGELLQDHEEKDLILC